MANKRPSSFVEWRAEWLTIDKYIGQHVSMLMIHNGVIVVDRDLWKLLHRERRIRARLKVEVEVKDSSFLTALWDMLEEESQE